MKKRFAKIPKSQGNVRHKKVEIDGIKFDSGLESRFYTYLKGHADYEILGIHVKLLLLDEEQTTAMNLIAKCKYFHRKQTVWTPDFYVYHKPSKRNLYIESKGYAGLMTPAFKLQMKVYAGKYDIPVLICTSLVKLEAMVKMKLIETVNGLKD
jgi:predicted DNA-binding ribbon-helix-helix protein